jgi:hypothetical protein
VDYDFDAAMDRHGNTTFNWLGRHFSVYLKRWPRPRLGRSAHAGGCIPRGSFDFRSQPDVTVGTRGDTVVSFVTSERLQEVVGALYRPRGGTWGPQRVLAKGDMDAGLQLAVSRAGSDGGSHSRRGWEP